MILSAAVFAMSLTRFALSLVCSFAIEARRTMPMTKLDQVLRAVRNGNFEFEKPEGKKGSSSSTTTTTRSGASPKKAAAPQVQPKEESATSSASSSQARAEDVSRTCVESRFANKQRDEDKPLLTFFGDFFFSLHPPPALFRRDLFPLVSGGC
jgi:hypothetical protein